MALGDRAGPDANEGEIATLEAEKAVLVGLVDFLMIREDCAVKLVLNLLHAVQDRSRSAHCSITKELLISLQCAE